MCSTISTPLSWRCSGNFPFRRVWTRCGAKRGRSTVGSCGDVALDIETHGVSPDTRWSITCVTAAMHTPRGVQSVLLNPLREPEHRKIFRRIVDNADRIVFHNCFAGDTRVLTRDGVKRFEDIAGTEVEVWANGVAVEPFPRPAQWAEHRLCRLSDSDGT